MKINMKVTNIVKTSSFKQGLKSLVKDHKTKTIDKLNTIILQLCNFEITSQYDNHPLYGKLSGASELHVENDLLLVYKYTDTSIIISLNLLDLTNHKNLDK